MITREDLDAFSAPQLLERAMGVARAGGDIDWLWHLLGSIPATEGKLGELEDSGLDIARLISAINGYVRADRSAEDVLRPQCIDYLLEHL